MKRIIRLTESDLARIVRRVIAEESQSTPNVGLRNLTFQVIDNKNNNLYKRHDVTSNGQIEMYLNQARFEPNEKVTLEIGGGFSGLKAEIYQESGTKKGLTVTNNPFTATFNVSDILDKTQGNQLSYETIVITDANVDGGTLKVNLDLSNSTIASTTTESYRRRYRRY